MAPNTIEPESYTASTCRFWAELRGFEPLTPSMRTPGAKVARGRWGRSPFGGSLSEAFAVDDVAVLLCCTALSPSPRWLVTLDRSGTASAGWKATVYRFVATEAGVEYTFAAG